MLNYDKKIKIPKILHELHGEEATLMDMILVYFTVLLTSILVIFFSWNISIETYKIIILLVLSIDLSGGVISNFTNGTSKYYTDRPKMRYIFISLHVIQPIVLSWIFPDDIFTIVIVSIYTLISMTMVNRLKNHSKQRLLGAFLMTLGLMLPFILSVFQPIVHIMLSLYIIKLIMAFAVQWK